MNISIPNTTMTPFADGGYDIAPNNGYVLHDKARDWEDGDGNIQRGYTRGSASESASYDFTPQTIEITDNDGNILNVTAYGEREFFAIPESTAPENNIFGNTNKPEIM